MLTLMVTDGWQQARDGFVQLWRHFRPESADAVASELDSTRTAALAAHESGASVVERALRDEWVRRITELLASHPTAAQTLREMLANWGTAPDSQTVHGGLRMEARATGTARIYQAGRDQHVTER